MPPVVAPAPPSPPVAETLVVKVNGRSVTVPKLTPDWSGKLVFTSMLQACELAGLKVPHYCYHPKLPIAGNCRMCLVEYGTPALGPDRKPLLNADGSPKITRSPRPAIACATPASPGMEIYTDTPAVKEMQRSVLEFLLINHPLDCPICDEAGECKLQEYAVDYGQARSRFVETKVHKPKQVPIGPRIMLDDERCILCSRCVRFTRDLVGDDALGIVNRGSYSTIAVYPGREFDNNYTLNTVDICPVGALTSRDFRFQMRVWFLKETKSVCTSCATGCNILIGSRQDQVYRYTPRQNEAVNSYWMCDYGRLNYKWINRQDRLTRVDGTRGKNLGWSDALREIAARLTGAASGSVAIVASARQTNEELWLLAKLKSKLGGLSDALPRHGEADHLLLKEDRNPNHNGARLTGIASPALGAVLPQISEAIQAGRIKTLLVFGEDVTRHGLSPEVLAKLETLIVSDILPNETTSRAHFVLPGCAHAEKRGTFTNATGRVQRFFKAIEPPGHARAESEFLADLVSPLTGESLPGSFEGLFNQMAREIPAFQGLRWSDLGDTGITVPL